MNPRKYTAHCAYRLTFPACLKACACNRRRSNNVTLPACISPVATNLFPESSFIILHHSVRANMGGLHLSCYKLALQVHMYETSKMQTSMLMKFLRCTYNDIRKSVCLAA